MRRGRLKGPDAKIKININRIEIKLCMSHDIHKSKACLMQNLSLVPFLFLKISKKFPSEEGNKSTNSDIYPRKVDLTLRKMIFESRIVFLDQKLTPPPTSKAAIFKQRKILSPLKFLRRLDERRAAATTLIDQFR